MRRLRAAYLAVPALMLATVAPSPASDEPSAPPGQAARIVAPGLVEPISEEIEIAADVIGRLKSVPVDEGDHIVRGQILAEIENADLKAALAVAEANLDKRRAELDKLRNGARAEEREEAAAQLAEAAAREAQARRELARKAPLAASGVESRSALDEASATAAAAEAKTLALSAQHALVDGAPRPEDVRIAEAEIAEAEANVAGIGAQIERTIIRSPIDGIVLSRQKKTGEAVANLPPTSILHIGDISRLRVRADVDELDIARVAVGQRVSVRADAFGDRRFGGTIARIGASLGRKSFRTDRPTEKLDTKILETIVDLDPDVHLPVGLRVDVWDDDTGPSTKTAPGPTPLAATSAAPVAPAAQAEPLPRTPAIPAPGGDAAGPVTLAMVEPKQAPAEPEPNPKAALIPAATFAGAAEPVSQPPRPVESAPHATTALSAIGLQSLPQVPLQPIEAAQPANGNPAEGANSTETPCAAAAAPLSTFAADAAPVAAGSACTIAAAGPTDAKPSPDPVTPAMPAPLAREAPATYGAPIAGARIVLGAIDDTWVQIRDPDGNPIFTRVLISGERYGVPDRQGLSLVAGNAAGLEIAVDGTILPPLGKPNRVARDVKLAPALLLQRLASAR